MIFAETGTTLPYRNFAFEYYMAIERDLGEDIFMLWRDEPSVIVGKFQNTLEEVNLEYTKKKGIHIARRLSGGGTVYHDLGCWQFTFVTKSSDKGIDFTRFLTPIIAALQDLGLDVRATGRNDIALYPEGSERGYKISGNSQYNKNGITVHHGTLLFDTDIEEMVRATTPKDYKITSKAIKSVRERVTNIRRHLKKDMTGEEFVSYLAERLTDVKYQYTDGDLKRIDEIEREMFTPDSWNLGSNPQFELKNTLHFDGGTIDIGLTVKHSVIISAGVTGDFFLGDADDIASALCGVEFAPEAVRTALTPFEGVLMNIDIDALVRGIFE